MKRINCFIPYGKIEATRQTVAQLAESSLVSQIYLITDDPHAKAIYPCNLIRTENIWSTKTLRGNSRLCQCPLYVNLYED